ncbi:hypothetical protein GCM10020229_60340 [Kitasatospora albolonga]|uniref:hypothetical protein n=1 Tax=Kitasatospora albolonga TaxID=68173 RepID=UPI0031EC569A
MKIRGYRVDPAELDAALAAHQAVDQAVAVPEDGALAAFYTTRAPGPSRSPHPTRTTALPRYMVPPRLAELAELPLDHNGKLDRRGLLLSTPPLAGREPDQASAGHAWPKLWATAPPQLGSGRSRAPEGRLLRDRRRLAAGHRRCCARARIMYSHSA